jgi:hypothetical protein
MTPSTAKWRRPRLVLLFAFAVCAAVLYDRGVRRIALGREFQYIPRESEMVVATGDIASLWSAADDFCHIASQKEWLTDAASELEKLKLPVTRLSDLQSYGLDLHRGILVSVYRPSSEPEVTAVIPIVSRVAFTQMLTRLQKMEPKLTSVIAGEHAKVEIYRFKHLYAAFPEPDLAVLSSSYDLIRRSVVLPSDNLSHAANNDALYEAVRHVLRRPLLTGPNIFAFWQSRTAPFNNRAAVIRVEKEELTVEGELELSGGTLRVVDDLRRRPQRSSDWAAKLPARTVATAILQDKSLPHYRNFVAEEILGDLFPDVASQLKRWTPNGENLAVTRVAFSVTDIRDDLPDFVIGVWGNKQQLAHVIEAAQQDLRRTRDLALLNGAINKYRQVKTTPPSVGDLERLRLLTRDDYSLLDRYQINSDGITTAPYQPGDFDNPRYKTTINGHTITFLAPPLGNDDLVYREGLKGADPHALQSDRYRMATAFDEDALWMATEPSDLQTILDRAPHGPHGSFLTRNDDGKLHVSIDVGKLMSIALASSAGTMSKENQDALRRLDFSTFTLDASPSFDETRLRFSAKLKRRLPL